jgi:hypothetical protein
MASTYKDYVEKNDHDEYQLQNMSKFLARSYRGSLKNWVDSSHFDRDVSSSIERQNFREISNRQPRLEVYFSNDSAGMLMIETVFLFYTTCELKEVILTLWEDHYPG